MPRLLLLFTFLLLSPLSRADYRLFVLQITSTDGSVREVLSTLDPDQYRGYHPLKVDDKITYTQTWRCRDRTGDFAVPCPNPRAVASEAPAP